MKICSRKGHKLSVFLCTAAGRLKVFILLAMALGSNTLLFSQTTPLSFTPIPYSDPDIISPGRGAEQWDFGSERINNPVADTNIRPMDVYYRFAWTVLEKDSMNSYDWTFFDDVMQQTIDNRQKLSFGIMPVYDGKGTVNYDGATSAYPLYLHKLMQSGSWNTQDWISNGVWIPNWNSTHYLTRLRALHEALYKHIMTTSYKGVAFKDAIYCIDIRGYGNYGEWHNAGIVEKMSEYPIGRRATVGTLKHIIAHHTQVFSQWPLVLMIAAFDADQFDAIMNPAELTHYALTTRNSWGPLGWRRDQWGATDTYLDKILKNNTKTFNNSPEFREWITSRYLTSPITGEPPNYVSPGGPCEYWDLERQLVDYGATSMGNGNFGKKNMSECGQNNVRQAFKRTGYRIILEGGNITSNLAAGKPLAITLDWKNIGIAPTYENWNVFFELRTDSNELVWTGTSKFKLKLFAPSATATSITDNFILPANLPLGSYRLNVIIKDPANYRAPFPLAIRGRNDDGSYTIYDVNTAPPTCIPPVAKIKAIPDCVNNSFDIVLDSSTGTAPFNIVVNDSSFKDVTLGQKLTTVKASVQSIFDTTPAPGSYEDAAVELGMKFKASSDGFISGIRFFSPASPSGSYKGHLWTLGGQLLDSAVFSNVTASAWQQAQFNKPVAIKGDSIYVVSYHTSGGHYSSSPGGLANAVVNGPLTALASDSSGGNGLYSYGNSPTFPANSFNASNYWVDVFFMPANFRVQLSRVTDSKLCSNQGDLQTLVLSSVAVCDTLPTDSLPTDSLPPVVVLPSAKLTTASNCNDQSFHLILDSASGQAPYDLLINETIYRNVSVGDTISTFSATPQHIWDSIATPSSYEDAPVELGMKFKTSTQGYIKGIRFFSPQSPGGKYTGHLWTSGGQLLDSVVFTNVTASGWQEALFANPVAVSADSIYIASYHTAGGYYAATAGGLLNSITNGALTVLGSDVSGGNGLYSYGPSPTLPTNSYNATNYWVDVVFANDTQQTYVFELVSVTDKSGNTKNGTLQTLMVSTSPCEQQQTQVAGRSAAKSSSPSAAAPANTDKIQKAFVHSLGQNYPNPLRSETVIPYSVAEAGRVNMTLFDLNGRLVKVLLNTSKEAGNHLLRVDAGTLSSGVYFYKMQTGNYSAVKKLIIQ